VGRASILKLGSMDGNDDFAERDALLLSEYPIGARNADRGFWFSTAYHIHEMLE
jgi:hypothetical protein